MKQLLIALGILFSMISIGLQSMEPKKKLSSENAALFSNHTAKNYHSMRPLSLYISPEKAKTPIDIFIESPTDIKLCIIKNIFGIVHNVIKTENIIKPIVIGETLASNPPIFFHYLLGHLIRAKEMDRIILGNKEIKYEDCIQMERKQQESLVLLIKNGNKIFSQHMDHEYDDNDISNPRIVLRNQPEHIKKGLIIPIRSIATSTQIAGLVVGLSVMMLTIMIASGMKLNDPILLTGIAMPCVVVFGMFYVWPRWLSAPRSYAVDRHRYV